MNVPHCNNVLPNGLAASLFTWVIFSFISNVLGKLWKLSDHTVKTGSNVAAT